MTDDILTSTMFNIFRSSLRILCQLNEISSCLNPWIITQSCSGDVAITALDMNPLYSTVGYAILEPLFTTQLQGATAPAWSILIGMSSLHITWTLNAMVSYTNLLLIIRLKGLDSSDESIDPPTFVARYRRDNPTIQFFTMLSFILPIISASIINACLLTLYDSVCVESLSQQPRIYLVAPIALIFFFTCRYADYEICRKTGRGRPSYMAVLLQLCLCGIRFCVRAAVGLLPFMPFQEMDHAERERLYGSDRYVWTEEGRRGKFFTTSWALALVGAPLTIFGYLLMTQWPKEIDRIEPVPGMSISEKADN
ncbi:hypothetical protein GLAREA_05811 [Glarea lozoyensis ATCC 20868]|uniref:Uncharacterized protein n=1 Tax=Glarea lozoyensis (strain ATCC 20868 / MF5171) TaxID=1116229 RepID=S3EDW2_GLAL2|nr:uncharacterized protein GLAREA_05811 [Glarea lozoyensis ATCC 20868]EPE36473.1 hypothetical protein GLAREA_05811 [Glarea lozoyensis ATCC 20868]